jgi:hypothetical protein
MFGCILKFEEYFGESTSLTLIYILSNLLFRTTPLDPDAYKKELDFIVETAEINGYKKSSIQKLWKKHRKKQSLREITTMRNKPDKTKNCVQN